MKVALYARAATHTADDDRTAAQIHVLRAYADQRGFEIVESYVCCDPNHSGATLVRPGLSRLRNGAQARAFDAIVVLTPDRLSRSCRDLVYIIEEFERRAVCVLFVDENQHATEPHGGPAIPQAAIR